MTDQELKDLVAENSRAIREMREEHDAIFKRNEKRFVKVNEDFGWFGNSFGRFTEGLFTPSLDKILLKDFGLDTVGHRVKKRYKDSTMEIDVLGYSNSEKNMAVVVEIKSRLRDDDIQEFLDVLKRFPKVYKEHKDKKILGMMAAVDISSEQKTKLEKSGIYVVQIKEDVFRVVSAKDFLPKDFGLNE